MPSLIDLRRRIRAVKSTQQITKAMKMIAASRLKRAQDRVVAARPFAQRMQDVLNGLVSRVDQDLHPLLHQPDGPDNRPLLIVVSGDRGLSGSFNSNIIKAAGQFIVEKGAGGRQGTEGASQVSLSLIGRKGRDFFKRRGFTVTYEVVGILAKSTFNDAVDAADAASEEFTSGRATSVHLVYNEFKSVMTQRVVVTQILPIPRLEAGAATGAATEYLYEPGAQQIFEDLLPRYVQIQIFRALLESNAAFFAAQMTAMDAATRNSSEMIENLTLYMNKVRQAAITREIIEVVSGAAAT
jgi:F-type H+-transporting ATPase subunit gamma